VNGKRKQGIAIVFVGSFALFLVVSVAACFEPGQRIGAAFAGTALDILKLLPCAFVLIGLFETWVKRETVQRHFGEHSGVKGCVWAVLLAGTTVGGLYVAFPTAAALYRKGASLSVIFTYIGAAGVCRIPMTMFEASFMGAAFTIVRLGVAVPLIVLTSIAVGHVLANRGYRISE